MVEFLQGVRAQPEYLAASREIVRKALADLDASVLRRGTSVILGIGASGHAASGYAARLRERGARAYAVSSGDGTAGAADCYIALSYSGRSRETVELLDSLGGVGARSDAGLEAGSDAEHGSEAGPAAGARPGVRIGVTGNPEAPMAGVVDHLVPLGGAEDSRVSTLSYTATVQALGLLAEAAWNAPTPVWEQLPDHGAAVLADATIGDRIASAFAGVSCVDVVGEGARSGSAGAAGLLLREAAHLPAAAYSLREYLHGPLEVAGPGRGALIFGEGRAVRLAEEMAGWGAPTVLVTADASARPDGAVVITLPDVPGPALDVLDILPVQVAAAELAERAGLAIELHHMPADTKLRDGAA